MKKASSLLTQLKKIIEELDDIEKTYILRKDTLKKLKMMRREISQKVEDKIEEMISLNKEVSSLIRKKNQYKKKFNELKRKKNIIMNKLKEVREKIRNRPKLSKPYEEIKRELENLELIYETSNLSRLQERKIVEKINSLTLIIKRYEDFLHAVKEERRLKEELNKINIKSVIDLIKKIDEKIKEEKEKINYLKREATELQKQINDIDKKYNEKYNELVVIKERMDILRRERDEILKPLGIKGNAMSYDIIINLIKSHDIVVKRALEKFSKGKTLTFEEFIILVKYGLI